MQIHIKIYLTTVKNITQPLRKITSLPFKDYIMSFLYNIYV